MFAFHELCFRINTWTYISSFQTSTSLFLLTSETPDYTEAILVVKPFAKLFSNFLFQSKSFSQGQICILYITLWVVKPCSADYKKFFLNFVIPPHTLCIRLYRRLVEVHILKDQLSGFSRKESSLKNHFLREPCFRQNSARFQASQLWWHSIVRSCSLFFRAFFFSNRSLQFSRSS